MMNYFRDKSEAKYTNGFHSEETSSCEYNYNIMAKNAGPQILFSNGGKYLDKYIYIYFNLQDLDGISWRGDFFGI